MSNVVFPTLPGLKWSITKTPLFNTLIQRSVNGRELRASLYQYPLYQWDLAFEFLRAASSYAELQTLMGFYLQRQGAFDTFLFDDTTDDYVAGQAIGTGDGTTTAFQMYRSLGGWIDPIYEIKASPVPNVYLAGSLQSSGYSIGYTQSGILTFSSAPGSGVAITADFGYYFRVRFCEWQDSSPDKSASAGDGFLNFMSQLWELKQISMVTAR